MSMHQQADITQFYIMYMYIKLLGLISLILAIKRQHKLHEIMHLHLTSSTGHNQGQLPVYDVPHPLYNVPSP